MDFFAVVTQPITVNNDRIKKEQEYKDEKNNHRP